MIKSALKYFFLCTLLWFVLLPEILPAVTLQEHVNGLIAKADHYSRQKGQTLLAINYINNAVKLQPRNLSIYYKRASIYGRLKLYTEAIKDLNLVIKNDPGRKKFPSALRHRAECYSMVGEYVKAISDYKRTLNNRTTNKTGKIWYHYAELLWFAGYKDEALKAINKGSLTGSHWIEKMKRLESKILLGTKVSLHRPFSN